MDCHLKIQATREHFLPVFWIAASMVSEEALPLTTTSFFCQLTCTSSTPVYLLAGGDTRVIVWKEARASIDGKGLHTRHPAEHCFHSLCAPVAHHFDLKLSLDRHQNDIKIHKKKRIET